MLADGTEMVRLEATTLDGPLVGKHLSREKFERCLPDGVCMADFVLAMDLAGTPQLGWWGDWRRPALGDMYLRPDLSTGVTDPDWPDTMSFLGSFTDLDGDPLPVCPRSLLRAQTDRLAAAGRGALRLRGRVLRRGGVDRRGPTRDQRAHPARRRPPQDAVPHQRSPEFLPLMRSAIRRLGDRVGGVQRRGGAGPVRAQPGAHRPGHGGGLDGAGQAGSARRGVRARACGHVHGPAVPGLRQRLHLHCRCGATAHPCSPKTAKRCATGSAERWSRWRGRRRSVSRRSIRSAARSTSPPCRPPPRGGQQGAAVRTITRPAASVRVEHRLAAADANPYLVLAAILAGGLAGLEERIDPPEPVTNLPWGLPDRFPRCPARSPPQRRSCRRRTVAQGSVTSSSTTGSRVVAGSG